MKIKLPNIEINGTIYKEVNDAKLEEIATQLHLSKTDEITVGIQLEPKARKLGYKKYTFAPEHPDRKFTTIKEHITQLAYQFTLHEILRQTTLEGLAAVGLKKDLKKLTKLMIGEMKVHKDLIVCLCNEHAIVIQGMIPEKAHLQAAESLPPIFTLVDNKTKAVLNQLKDLGAIEGCKIFYMESKDIK